MTLRNFDDFEAYLGRFTNYERMRSPTYERTNLGVERMRALAAALGDPQEAYPCVHVAGTKGKGTTCLLLEAMLQEEGFSVGTYLSPHVERLTERIRVGGRPVDAEDLVRETNGMLVLLDRLHASGPSADPTFFELMTGLAMTIFAVRDVGWAVFEVGLGGRLDATNILRPRLCAITSIGLEHTQQLGDTLAQIAREKAGIIKPGVPTFLGPLYPEAEAEIVRIAAERGAPLLRSGERDVLPGREGRLRLAPWDAEVDAGPVRGPALRGDLALALALLRAVLAEEGRSATPARVAAALARVELPARVELVPGDPPVVIDAAHTAEAARSLGLALEEIRFPRPRTLIVSMAEGKQTEAILRELEGVAEDVIWTRADAVRSVDPELLRQEAGRGSVVESPEGALEAARRRGHAIVVTGSFYLAGRLRPLIRR